MNWLKRKLRNWINDYDNETVLKLTASCDVLNFRVFSAVGGQVVEFRRYDRKTDRSDTSTYIIHKEDDFGDKISKIANLELLR
jgi:hypothetical protein